MLVFAGGAEMCVVMCVGAARLHAARLCCALPLAETGMRLRQSTSDVPVWGARPGTASGGVARQASLPRCRVAYGPPVLWNQRWEYCGGLKRGHRLECVCVYWDVWLLWYGLACVLVCVRRHNTQCCDGAGCGDVVENAVRARSALVYCRRDLCARCPASPSVCDSQYIGSSLFSRRSRLASMV